MCEGTENFKNRANLLKEKFQTFVSLSQQSSTVVQSGSSLPNRENGDSNKKESPYITELKKLDIFDLGILLVIAATGGLDVISEEALSAIQNLSSSCCILHAVQGSDKRATPQQSKGFLLIRKILNRLSTQA